MSKSLDRMIDATMLNTQGVPVRITGHSVPGSMFCVSLDPTQPCYEIASGLVEMEGARRQRGVFQRLTEDEGGQDVLEYALLLGLVATVLIGLYLPLFLRLFLATRGPCGGPVTFNHGDCSIFHVLELR